MPKYYMPTTLLSGKNCIKRHPRHLIHGKHCMIITGRHSAEISGALSDVTDVLQDKGIEYEIYNKITPETGITEIYNLARLIKEHEIDYIIGIGGGSTLDAAKAAAVYAANDIEPMQIFDEKYSNKPLTVVCVPTTAGTGSDTTQYVMMTLDDVHKKKSFCSEDCFPYATYLDSRYTKTLPTDVTRNTAIDALCHSVESYINVNASPFSDIVALEGIRLIGQCAPALISGEFTESDREKLCVAASTGGMAVAHTGLNVVHAMGHQLTIYKDIPHGRANGSLLTEFISWAAKTDLIRAVDVMTNFGMDLSSFKKFINAVIPTDEVITESDIDTFMSTSIVSSTRANCPRLLTPEDERMIYKNALIDKNRIYTEW